MKKPVKKPVKFKGGGNATYQSEKPAPKSVLDRDLTGYDYKKAEFAPKESPKVKAEPKAPPSPITNLTYRGTTSTPKTDIRAKAKAVAKPKPAAPAPKAAVAEPKKITPASSAPKPAPKPVKSVPTKGGEYKVYAKSSDKAAEFRKKFAAASEGSVFEFDGRKYTKRTKK